MRTRFDEFSKDLVGAVLKRGGPVVKEHHIVGPGLDIDVWFRPDRKRLSALADAGLLGRMAAFGPCLIEPYRNTPGISQMRTCLCKQYILHHECVVEARRANEPQPEFPRLWLVSSGRPETILEKFHFTSMPGWPHGCYASSVPFDARHVIVARELPPTRDTLLLRLLGRGPTFQQAITDLLALPSDAWERDTATPLVLAFRVAGEQDPGDKDMQEFMNETQRLVADWERRVRDDGRQVGERTVVARLLANRFGPLSAETLARLDAADSEQLETWFDRLLDVEQIDDLFTE